MRELPDNVEELCKQLEETRQNSLNTDLGPWPKNNPTASDISDCPRETVLAMTNWKDRPRFDFEVRARLDRGNEIENMVMRQLGGMGFTVRVDRRPFEIKDKKGRLICRGIVDGFVTEGLHGKTYPLEIKSMTPNMFSRINCQEDFDRYFYLRKYPRQLQTYMYANEFPEGLWVLDDCLGHQKFIPCRLDYDRMEKILQHLETAVDHREAGTLPDFHKDPAVCLKCWAFKRICNPPFFRDEGLKVFNDPELESKISEFQDLKISHAEYERLDRELRPVFKDKTNYIIGKWLVTGEKKPRNFKAAPAKEATTTYSWATKFELIDKAEKASGA